MMKPMILIFIVISSAYCSNDSLVNGVFHVNANLVLKTTNQKETEKQLCSRIDNMGGWLLNASVQQLRFRVPQDSVDRFLGFIGSLGVTTDKFYSRNDFTRDYLKLITSLQAKEYLLKQYFNILDSSGTEGIYPVSREIADLQKKIEIIKGQIRGMVERMNYAEITIRFNFSNRRVPLVSGHSDFDWLNTVNLPGLLEDFR